MRGLIRQSISLLLLLSLVWAGPASASPKPVPAARPHLVRRVISHPVVKTTGRVIAAPFKTAPARFTGRVIKRILQVDKFIGKHVGRWRAKRQRKRAAAFDARVRAAKGDIRPVRVGKARDRVQLKGEQLDYLRGVFGPLLRGMDGVAVKIIDPIRGTRRRLKSAEVDHAIKTLTAVNTVLKRRSVSAPADGKVFSRLMADPNLARAVLAEMNLEPTRRNIARYRRAMSALDGVEQAYLLYLHLPGQKQGDPGIAEMAGADGTLTVAVRRRTPDAVVAATEVLTKKYFRKITHLWLDPIMAGEPGAAARLKKQLADPAASKLIDVIDEYAQKGAVGVFAAKDGKPAKALEARVRTQLADLNRKAATRTLRTDFYARASEETKESFMQLLILGSTIGVAMDHIAEATQNPTILQWKPTVLGGWDDTIGAAINGKEMIENGVSIKDVAIDVGISASVGIGTSVALGTGILPGGQSVAQVMMHGDLASRMLASGLYGVASSGGTLTMSFLPIRHYYRPILDMVADGRIVAPTDKRGLPLRGRALKWWALRQARKTHHAFTAQWGGFVGVWLAGGITAGFGAIPAWGGPALANVLLTLGGSAETLTTGGYLVAREWLDRRAVRRGTEAALRDIARTLRPAKK